MFLIGRAVLLSGGKFHWSSFTPLAEDSIMQNLTSFHHNYLEEIIAEEEREPRTRFAEL